MARADCIHRYTFTDGVKDSVGKADGTLKGAAKVADGQLTLTNTDKYSSDNDASYVDFAAPLLPKEGSVSIVMWFTGKDCGPFSRLLDIGKNGDAAAFIYFTPRTSEDQSRVAISAADTGSKTAVDAPLFDDGKPHMVALVVDAPAKKFREFIDGKEVGTPADLGDNTLDKVKQEHSWIGRSSFDSDPALARHDSSASHLRPTADGRRVVDPVHGRPPRHAR